MGRHFYLLCLFLVINHSICYDDIYDQNLNKNHEKQVGRINRHHKHKAVRKHHVTKAGYKYGLVDDKEPVAQIDVAKFIQKPDEYANNDPYDSITKTNKPNIKNYDYGSPSEYNFEEDIAKRSNKRPYYQNPADKPFDLGPNPFPYKDAINSQHLNLDSLPLHGLNNGKIARNTGRGYARTLSVVDSNVHNTEKKCAIKQMLKFPFFSRDKSETGKPKKRKMFCFNCSTKKEKQTKPEELSEIGEIKDGSKKVTENISKVTLADTDNNVDKLDSKQSKRDKRQEWLDDRERQLKELEELQKKVDSVEIISRYGKMPESSATD